MRWRKAIVFAAGVAMTAGACVATVNEQDRQTAAAFRRDAERIAADTASGLQTYFDTLLSIKGLLTVNDSAAADAPALHAQLARFIAALRLHQRYPGFQAIQFVRPVADADLTRYADAVRRDGSAAGQPQFVVHPSANVAIPIHYVVDFVDTLKGNEQAFGLDLTALSPSLQQTLELARDSGAIVASERLLLMQDLAGKHEQPGFAARLAVYRRGEPVATVQQRRAALAGFVGIVFRVEQLMAEVIDGATRDAMAIRIEDAGLTAPGAQRLAPKHGLLYDSAGVASRGHAPLSPWLTTRLPLEVGQRRWNLVLTAYEGGPYRRDPGPVLLVALAGIAVSALMAMLAGGSWRRLAPADERDAAADQARRQAETALAEARRALARSETELLEQKALVDAAHDDLSGAMSTLKHAQSCLAAADNMASLGTLVAGIAHELNTPIGNSLLTATALQDMARDFELSMRDGAVRRSALETHLAETRQACGILTNSLMRAAELIASFKQVAVDQSSGQSRRFALADVIRDTLAAYRAQLRRAHCEVGFDVAPGLMMDSYPGCLVQVLSNLLGNALLHGFDGLDAGRIDISARADGDDWVVLVLRDNGVGMTAPTLHRVFDPFFTTRMGQGGSGLGMHIVHELVTGTLGGSIAVESAPGRGTAVRLTLPVTAP